MWKRIFGLPKAVEPVQASDELPEYLRADQLAIHAEAAGDAGAQYRPWRVDADGEQWFQLVQAGEAIEPESFEGLELNELLEPRSDLSADELFARFQQRMAMRDEDYSNDGEPFFESDDFADSDDATR